MSASAPSSIEDPVVQLLSRVRALVSSYEGGEPMQHAYRMIRAVAHERSTEMIAMTALLSAAGFDRLRELGDHAGHAEVTQLLDAAITTLAS